MDVTQLLILCAAGATIDPVVSVPIASGAKSATTVADPELDPEVSNVIGPYGFKFCPFFPLYPLGIVKINSSPTQTYSLFLKQMLLLLSTASQLLRLDRNPIF